MTLPSFVDTFPPSLFLLGLYFTLWSILDFRRGHFGAFLSLPLLSFTFPWKANFPFFLPRIPITFTSRLFCTQDPFALLVRIKINWQQQQQTRVCGISFYYYDFYSPFFRKRSREKSFQQRRKLRWEDLDSVGNQLLKTFEWIVRLQQIPTSYKLFPSQSPWEKGDRRKISSFLFWIF